MKRGWKAGRPVVHYAAVLALALPFGVSGCGSSPQERFFTLASEAPAPAGTEETATELDVVVGPVTIPEIVDRPQIVLRTAPNRVELAEQARWAAPLKDEIARVVADHLARLLQGVRASTLAQRAGGAADYRVLIDIQRFESVPQQGATIQASWTVRNKDGTARNGRSIVTERSGSSYDDLVAAHSRALAALSRDIAAAIAAARARTP